MQQLDKSYNNLLRKLLEKGSKKSDRTNTGTLSLFGEQIRHDMKEGFPLLTTKKIHFKSVLVELLWFLDSVPESYKSFKNTNIKYLVDNNVNIWNEWPYKSYCEYRKNLIVYLETHTVKHQNALDDTIFSHKNLTKELESSPELSMNEFINKIKTDSEFAIKWGECGPIYGKQWINYGPPELSINQIEILIKSLNDNPNSRRLLVDSWNVVELNEMLLPPCHYSFQCYTKDIDNEVDIVRASYKLGLIDNIPNPYDVNFTEFIKEHKLPNKELSLKFNMRSTDVLLGLPFNIASYGILLLILCQQSGMIPGELIYDGGDVHLYQNHIEFAKQQIERDHFNLPRLKINPEISYNKYRIENFNLENYNAHPNFKNVPIAV